METLGGRSLIDSNVQWLPPTLPQARAEALAAGENVSPPMARVLLSRSRGRNPHRLLQNELADLSSPFELRGMERVVERIEQALVRDEQIFIHGDFDVDGLTSAALLYRVLRRLGARNVKVEIGDRARGHGLSPEVVQRAADHGVQLFLTTDCGISDVECVKALRAEGMSVILTDHHSPPEELPPADAIVNPKQTSCSYPNANLAAVGVIYQTASALFEHLGKGGAHDEREFLDLAMLGTVGDLVPLVSAECMENRILVKGGLDRLARGEGTLGVKVLLEKLALDPRKLTAGEVSYAVAPKLNAANRVGDPRVAFLLLTTEDLERAEYWAGILLQYNRDRQRVQETMRARAEELLEREIDLKREKAIILSERGWNPGVIGLVASDLVDACYLPTILISEDGDAARASARSIVEFNMIEGLTRHRHLFERFGGHHMAAGFSMAREQVPRLKEEFSAYARDQLDGLRGPVRSIDGELCPEEITLELHRELQRLGPFGVGNGSPRFLLQDARVVEARAVGSGGKHLKMRISAGGRELNTIGFDMGAHIAQVYGAGPIDVVFKLARDDWNGRSSVQLEVLDILESQPQRRPVGGERHIP